MSPTQYDDYSIYVRRNGEGLPHEITHEKGRLIIALDREGTLFVLAGEMGDHSGMATAMGVRPEDFDRWTLAFRRCLSKWVIVESISVGIPDYPFDAPAEFDMLKNMISALSSAGFPGNIPLRWVVPDGSDIALQLAEWQNPSHRAKMVSKLKGL